MNKNEVSLKDTSELRKLIIENPQLPLLIFASEDCNSGNYGYEQCNVGSVSIDELTLYDGGWIDKEQYGEELNDDYDKEEYRQLSNDEYADMIDKMVEEGEFVKAIVVYVG